jgi:hypothetical protein
LRWPRGGFQDQGQPKGWDERALLDQAEIAVPVSAEAKHMATIVVVVVVAAVVAAGDLDLAAGLQVVAGCWQQVKGDATGCAVGTEGSCLAKGTRFTGYRQSLLTVKGLPSLWQRIWTA